MPEGATLNGSRSPRGRPRRCLDALAMPYDEFVPPLRFRGPRRSRLRTTAIAALLGAFLPIAAQASSGPLPPERLPQLPALSQPTAYLPQLTRRLVLRLGERRVYLYRGSSVIASYPVAIGRAGWETPTGQFQVRETIVNPSWQHPFTHEVIPPGERNPLGVRWIGFWSDGTNAIGFHGTPNPTLIGQAVSHGCVRMHNRDIADLFEQVEVGMAVVVEP